MDCGAESAATLFVQSGYNIPSIYNAYALLYLQWSKSILSLIVAACLFPSGLVCFTRTIAISIRYKPFLVARKKGKESKNIYCKPEVGLQIC